MLRTVVLSGALALCTMLVGCVTSSPSPSPGGGDPAAEAETSSALTGTCDQFCQSQGGSFYRSTFATSESACTQRAGDWYPADGFSVPDPGCCCKCGLLSGNCL